MRSKSILAATLLLSFAVAQAAQREPASSQTLGAGPAADRAPKSELISLQTIEAGGAKVDLPTTREANGDVCVSYLASGTRLSDGQMDLKVGRRCDKALGQQGPRGAEKLRAISAENATALAPATVEQKPAAAAQPQLLSLRNIESGGVTVLLPTTRDANGVVCVGYLESAARDASGVVSLKVGKYCGEGLEKPIQVGGHEAGKAFWPKGLDGLQTIEREGLVSQVAVTAR